MEQLKQSAKTEWFTKRNLITSLAVVVSAFVMAAANNVFLDAADLLPGGFMGLAVLGQKAGSLIGWKLSTALLLTLINLPVAVFSAKTISKRFVFFSLANVLLTSLFLKLIPHGDEVVKGGFSMREQAVFYALSNILLTTSES